MKTKHLILSLFAFMAALLTSCTDKETVAGTEANGTKTVTFNVTTDAQAQTRAGIPGVTGYKLNYVLQVLDASGNPVTEAAQNNQTGTFTVSLPIGATYTCLFWADFIPDSGSSATDNEYFTTTDLKAVALKQALTGEDQCQAFCGTASIAADQVEATTTVVLKRAVAQVNLRSRAAMQDYSKLEANYTNVPNTFNVSTNETSVSGATGVAPNFTVDDLSVATGANSFTFQSAYFLAPGTEDANMVKIELKTYNSTSATTPIETLTIANVPTKKNYKTNVTGDFKPATVSHTYAIDFNDWEASDFVSDPRIWDGTTATASSSSVFSGGTGAQDDPYIIGKAADLAQLAADVNAGTGSGTDYAGKYFKQTTDIDLNNKPWTPIGTKASGPGSPFKGCYDGNMHKIENLSINVNSSSAGLFGYVDMSNNDVYITNLHVSGNVTNTSTDANAYTGGIVGYANTYRSNGHSGGISGCSFDGAVTGKTNVGGICGFNYNFNLSCCVNYGNVTGESNVGGIIAYLFSVSDCYNTGTITGQTNVGGISGTSVGMASSTERCYNIGIIQGASGYESSSSLGAISGYNGSDGDCTDCYAATQYSYSYGGSEKTFGSSAWPTSWSVNTAGSGTEPNGSWKSLGGWNGGTPTYPTLWWEVTNLKR